MNPLAYLNPPPSQPPSQNQNQGSTVATILVEPWTKDVDVGIVTRGGVTTGGDGTQPQVRLVGKKKAHFDIATKRDTSFEVHEALGRNPSKTPIFVMPSAFDSSLEAGPSWNHGTLQQFF